MKNFYDYNDDQFRSKLINHEFELMPSAWDDLSAKMDGLNTQAEAAGTTWWKSLVVGVGLVIGGLGTGWGIYQTQKAPNPALADASFQYEKVIKKYSTQVTNNNALPQASIQDNTSKSTYDQINTPNSSKQTNNQTPVLAVADNAPKHTQDEQKVQHGNQQMKSDVVHQTTKSDQDDKNTADAVVVAAQEEEPKTNVISANPKKSGKTRTEIIRVFSTSKLKAFYLNESNPQQIKLSKYNNGGEEGDLISLQRFGTDWESPLKFGAYGGANVKGGQGRQKTVRPMLGVFARYSVAARHAIEVGLQYKYAQLGKRVFNDYENANANEATSINPNLREGLVMTQAPTVVYPVKGFHWLELPVKYRYSVHPKHHLSVGVKAAYLTGVNTGDKGVSSGLMTSGTTQRFDIGCLAGYEFSVCDHIDLGVNYNIGFVNLGDNMSEDVIHYNGNAASMDNLQTINVPVQQGAAVKMPENVRNSDLQLFLKYTF